MIVHLDDVGPEVVRKLYEGVTGICNARWFGSIWTAMELVRSGRVRTMTSDGRLVADEEAVEPVFLNKLHAVWADEVRLQHNCVFCVEEAAGMTHDAGGNLVPWNLGPLLEVKRLRRTNFAMAYALLSLRGGRDRMDFLHAFCGIVVGGTEARPLDADFHVELARTAEECLVAGDYSPLLITTLAEYEYQARLGYDHVMRWEIGEEVSPPSIAGAITLGAGGDKGTLTVELERIGTVSEVLKPPSCSGEDSRSFPFCARVAPEQTGPDLHAFVDTLGGRLYGEDTAFIMSHLEDTGALDGLCDLLERRHRDSSATAATAAAATPSTDQKWPDKGDDGTDQLAETLTLSRPVRGRSESRFGLLAARYGTIHCHDYNHLLSVACGGCGRASVFRTGAFVRETADLVGATAYRVPGLQYLMSLPGGMALLEKDGRILGRMVWATPACPCRQTEVVRLILPKFPDPQPQKGG